MAALTKNITGVMETYFGSELIAEYQRKGSQLKKFVRGPHDINAKDAKFYVVSKVEASDKARGEKITVDNPEHGDVLATLKRKYHRADIESQDEARLDFPQIRGVYASAGAMAVGRACDNIILTDGLMPSVANGSGSTAVGSASTSTGMTIEKGAAAVEILTASDVGEGNFYALIGPQQWQDLMRIPEFASTDFVDTHVWSKAMPFAPKYWNGVMWMVWTGLPVASNVRTCFVWDRDAVGFADSDGMGHYTEFLGDYDSNIIVSYVDAAACAIQEKGIVPVYCQETALSAYASL